MIKSQYLGIIILCLSCTNGQENVSQTVRAKDTVVPEIIIDTLNYHRFETKALILGRNIKLLNDKYTFLKDISYLNEQVVDVLGVSKKNYKQDSTEDDCQKFKYVVIRTKNLYGIVDGRNIYYSIKGAHSDFKIGNNRYTFNSTKYFGKDAWEEGFGLTGCEIRTPVIFSDRKSHYEGLIKMVKNEFYSENYPYFELKDDMYAQDSIVSLSETGGRLIMGIIRTGQTAVTDLRVSVYKSGNYQYFAEVIQNKFIKWR